MNKYPYEKVHFCLRFKLRLKKAGAWAVGFGFTKTWARPKAVTSQSFGLAWLGFFLAWLGLAQGFKPKPAHHY
jgi:hypothetical protein